MFPENLARELETPAGQPNLWIDWLFTRQVTQTETDFDSFIRVIFFTELKCSQRIPPMF